MLKSSVVLKDGVAAKLGFDNRVDILCRSIESETGVFAPTRDRYILRRLFD